MNKTFYSANWDSRLGRITVSESVEHYHREWNHQGIENRLIAGGPEPTNTNSRLLRKCRLGGLLTFYHRAA